MFCLGRREQTTTAIMLRPHPARRFSFELFLTVAATVILSIILPASTSAATATPPLTTTFTGPEVAQYGSTVVLKCSWLADDLVYRVLWRIQPAFGNKNEPLEYSLKNSPQEPAAPLNPSSADNAIQGEAAVDARNNFSTLTLRNVTFAAEGNYTCSISSVSAEKVQNKSMRVVAAPDQMISRLNMTANSSSYLSDGALIGPYFEGTGFEINCFVALSRPPANIRWYKKNVQGQLSPLESQSGPQKQQMDASGVWRVNRPLYFRLDSRQLIGSSLICQAENEASMAPVQQAYRLDMLVPPTSISLTGVGPGINLREGVTYNITCEAQNAKPFATITWNLDREPVTRFVRNDTVPTPNGTFNTRSTFVYSANPDDNGKMLSCIATQEVLTVQRRGMSDTRILNVIYSPRNIMTSKSQLSLMEYHRPESDLTGGINCSADANPPAQYIWVFDGALVTSSPALLFNHNVTRDESGDYFCIASNNVGQTNITLRVDVQHRPFCTRCDNSSAPCLIGAAVGQQQSISCQMAGNPSSDMLFLWNVNQTDDSEMATDDGHLSMDRAYDSPAASSTSSLLTTTSSSFNYTVRSSDDYHRLLCWARNRVGTAMQPCYFTIVPAGPPHPPENCSIITVMASGFSLKCRPGFDGGHPQKFIMLINNAIQDSEPTARIASSSSLKSLRQEPDMRENSYPEWLEKGLTAGQEYKVTVMARNEAGVSPAVSMSVRTLRVDEAAYSPLSTAVIAAIAGSLGGLAFLVLIASITYFCIRRSKKGESNGAISETHSNNSSSGDSKSDLVKNADNSSKHPDIAKNGAGSQITSLRYQRNGSKQENPVAEVTYTRACDLQSAKSFKPIIAPKPPVMIAGVNGRSPDRTQYAVIDFAKNNNKRSAPRPSGDTLAAHDHEPHPPPSVNLPPVVNGGNHNSHESYKGGNIIRTVAVV